VKLLSACEAALRGAPPASRPTDLQPRFHRGTLVSNSAVNYEDILFTAAVSATAHAVARTGIAILVAAREHGRPPVDETEAISWIGPAFFAGGFDRADLDYVRDGPRAFRIGLSPTPVPGSLLSHLDAAHCHLGAPPRGVTTISPRDGQFEVVLPEP
jgi:hypothetical protein